jgi:multisubunit Na+/H+ antiporter MnhE subunit
MRGAHGKARSISAGALTLSVVIMAAEWVLLVGGLKRDEMIVGAMAVLLGAMFLWRALEVASEPLHFHIRDLLTLWRLPWMMLSDVWTVTVVLVRDLMGIERAGSFYRVSGFRTALHDPLLVARRVLATVYTTSTPNSIVIGTDPSTSRMLIHQLRREPTSQLQRDLGAQS